MTAVSRLSPSRSKLGLWLFILALALRAGWVGVQWHRMGPSLEFDDERLHWALAKNLVHTGQMVSDDGRFAARMPLYPLFLAIFAGAGSSGILMARLAQALLGAATVWLVYRLARDALGVRPALLAGALACVDPYAIFFTNLLLSEPLFTLIAVAATTAAWRLMWDRFSTCPSRHGPSASQLWHRPSAFDSTGGTPVPQSAPVPRPWPAALAVALFGAAAVLTRPSALGWVVLLWALLWLYDSNKGRASLHALCCAAVLCVFLLPWGVRNQRALGSFAWLSTNGGVTLYDGQGPQASGSSNQEFLSRMLELRGVDEVQRDQLLRTQAIEQMKSNPVRVLKLAGTKFLRTWSLVPNFESYRVGLAAITSAVFSALVMVLAAGGLWRTISAAPPRPSGKYQMLVLLPVIYFTLLHCIFIGSLRYRVPLMPFLELSAAAAIFASGARRRNQA